MFLPAQFSYHDFCLLGLLVMNLISINFCIWAKISEDCFPANSFALIPTDASQRHRHHSCLSECSTLAHDVSTLRPPSVQFTPLCARGCSFFAPPSRRMISITIIPSGRMGLPRWIRFIVLRSEKNGRGRVSLCLCERMFNSYLITLMLKSGEFGGFCLRKIAQDILKMLPDICIKNQEN